MNFKEAKMRCRLGSPKPWKVDLSKAKTFGGGAEDVCVKDVAGYLVAEGLYDADAEFIVYAAAVLPEFLDLLDDIREIAEAGVEDKAIGARFRALKAIRERIESP